MTGRAPSTPAETTEDEVRAVALRARQASFELATVNRGVKDQALHAMADALEAGAADLLTANAADVAAAREAGAAEPQVDRLALNPARLAAMAQGLRDIAALPDPVGEVVRGFVRPNGLEVRQVRVPLGVLAVVYEARPNVTVDAAGLALKSGNASLLRGSASAIRSNRALVAVLSEAAVKAGLPEDAVQLAPGSDRSSVGHLLRARGLVDVVIPRGGAELIRHVVENARVPVIETGTGNVHVYVDAEADLEMAEQIVLNAKTSRPSVCNAAESLLVHRSVAAEFLPRIVSALHERGVLVHGDDHFTAVHPAVRPATEQDWQTEYLALELSARVVADVDEAISHIRQWSSGHSEAIVTGNLDTARRFVSRIDSAAVLVNASTRFVDGAEFGFGAEIGISTQKLHARGPMGLTELTSTKWVVFGDGQVRG